MVQLCKSYLTTWKGAMEMKFIIISLKNFCFNLRSKVFDRLLLSVTTDDKYKWPPPVSREFLIDPYPFGLRILKSPHFYC